MSIEDMNLYILLSKIEEDAVSGFQDAVKEIRKRYPSLSEKEAKEIHLLITESLNRPEASRASLVATLPPTFTIKVKSTKVVVREMLERAEKSIIITGYSMSDYFGDELDCIIRKSQQGKLVRFYVNNIDNQGSFDKLCRYKGKFLKIYNYPKQEDAMAALHAKVISIDGTETLITSANLSYHGQEGNIELGTYIVSSEIARQIDEIFTKLLFKKIFVEI